LNIVVLCKPVFDTEAKIKLKDGSIDSSGVNIILNPYDEFGVEEALGITEKYGGEVIILSAGCYISEVVIRQALAMGADRAIVVEDEALEGTDAHGIALTLAKSLEGVEYDIILSGMVAIDDNGSQVNSRLAEILNIPQVTVVQKLEISEGKAVCERQGDGTTEDIEVQLPALFSATKGLNEPRYPSLKGIMMAKKKEVKQVVLADLGLSREDVKPQIEIVEYSLPEPRQAGKILEGEVEETVAELVNLLHEEAKAI